MFFQHIENQSPSLSVMVTQFNFFPSLYTDESWWRAYGLLNIYKKLAKNPPAHRRLSRYLLERLKVSGRHDFLFEKKAKKLALLPANRLLRLIRVLGLVSHTSQLRRIVLGSELKRLQEFVGKEDYDLALRLSFACESRFPAVSAEMTQAGLVGAIASHVEERGMSILAKVFGSSLSDAFVKRFLLKMPERLNAAYGDDSINVPIHWLEDFTVRTMILMDPKWRALLS